MKLLISLVIALSGQWALAKSPTKASERSPVTKVKRNEKFKTELDFSDRAVKGQFQQPSSGVVTVENEKAIDDLLGIRKHFKDRMKESANRH
ncbi:MAG: hypothetical protein IT289_12180 [Oligoflexia bacterium]|nr:hypothetical protein [Oligoflexia bacterium]